MPANRRERVAETALLDRLLHEIARQCIELRTRGAAHGLAQQRLLERAAVLIDAEADQAGNDAQQSQQLPGAARKVAQHQREQRVATCDGSVEIEYGDGHE